FVLCDSWGEVASNLLLHSEVWRDRFADPVRWRFFLDLTSPFGFLSALFVPALVPTLPLVGFSFMDVTGFRAVIGAQYAAEYLGFLMAAILIGLSRLGLWARSGGIGRLTAAGTV